MTMEADKPRICSVGWQVGDPRKPTGQIKSKGKLLVSYLLLREAGLFGSIQVFN